MDILVSKNKSYYNFYSAEKKNGKVYLTELKKNLKKLVPIKNTLRAEITPSNELIEGYEYLLIKVNGKYFAKGVEIIERYDPTKHYINTFNTK